MIASNEALTLTVKAKFQTLRESVRMILLEHGGAIRNMREIEDVYRLLDFRFLKNRGLPWLDRDAYNALHVSIHQIPSIERVARKIWADAQNGREDPDLILPVTIKRRRRLKEKAHRRMFADAGAIKAPPVFQSLREPIEGDQK
jgi:hypothetical protein